MMTMMAKMTMITLMITMTIMIMMAKMIMTIRVSKNAQARKRRLQKMEVKSGFRRKFEEGT